MRTSAIAGRGLFAAADLPAGAVVLRFAAAPTSADDLGPANHSCDPNLGWTDARTLCTVRDVPAGQELTVDYATVLVDPAFTLWCHCGTYRCRQVIEGTDWRIAQLQRRYAGRWAPVAQRLIDGAGG